MNGSRSSSPGARGYEYAGQFKVRAPGAIAVDNSTSEADPTRGDVYVAGAEEKESLERNDVYEYSPSRGEVVHRWKTFKVHEKVGGEVREEELELELIAGLGVDASGALWVYWEEEGNIAAFSKQLSKGGGSKLVWQPSFTRTPEVESKFECFATPAFAVAPGREFFYVGYERESGEESCPGEFGQTPDSYAVAQLDGAAPLPHTVRRALDHENTTGVAVDSASGDVYLDNVASVAAFTPSGLLIQRFGEGEIAGGSGIAVDANTGQVFVPQNGEDRVAVFAEEGEAHAPVIDATSAQNLTPEAAQLSAGIDPRGAETEYHFAYGTAGCAVSAAACTPVPAGKITAGFGDVSVSANLTGLSPATGYYFRVIAGNSQGSVEAGPRAFTTLPSASVLPDGRAWEMVSPAEKHGAAVEPFQLAKAAASRPRPTATRWRGWRRARWSANRKAIAASN